MPLTWRCLWIVALFALTACGSPQPTAEVSEAVGDPMPSVGASGQPSGAQASTSVMPEPAANCAPPAEPGPADEPNRGGGDLMDLSDYGGARWRLCLTGPILASVEGRGSCLWNPDRQSVTEVFGHDTRIGSIDYGAWVALKRGEFQLGTTDRAAGGLIATYVPGASQPFADVSDDGRVGQLAFDVTVMIDPESGAPVGAPPRHVGSLRWICGDPPPPA